MVSLDLRDAVWALKNLEHSPEREAAVCALARAGFTVAKFLPEGDDGFHAVDTVESGDRLRGRFSRTLTLYRNAHPKFRAGLFWSASAASTRIQTPGSFGGRKLWRVTVDRNDPALLAQLITVERGREYVLDIGNHEILPV